ncbi:MAG: hypothetical protein VZR64_03765 [Eubacterium sp.]|nr:hypothetical protein [Eubacterium sp.]
MNISFKKNRIIAVILAMFIIASSVLGIFGKIDSYAEDVSIVLAIWPTDVQVGDAVTATVTITGESLGEFDIFLEFPDDILQYTDGDSSGTIEIMGSGTKTLTYNFKAIANGEGKIQTSGYKIYDVNGTQLSVVHAGGNIMVGETASTEDTIKIGNDTYTLVNDRRLPTPPEGYTISSVTYNDKEIYAYQSPTQNIKVVCLQNDEWEQKWFIYDEKKKEFSPFVEYSLDGTKYVIINKPDDVEIPEWYSQTSLTLSDCQLVAYTDNSDSGLYLVYALNSTGKAGLYFFDTDEGSIIRYDAIETLVDYELSQNTEEQIANETSGDAEVEKTIATPLIPQTEAPAEEDEGFFTKSILKKLLYMMVILFIIMCVVVIILIIRNGMLQSQLYGEDYDDEDDDIVEKARKDAQKTADEESKDESSDPMTQNQIKTGKSNSYDVNEDTGEILLVEAADNNSGVNVPPAEDNDPDKIEKAMAERPYGYDSAFDVVSVDEAPEGEHVYREPEPDNDSFVDPSKFDKELERKNLNAKNKLRAIAEADKIAETSEDKTEEITETIQEVQESLKSLGVNTDGFTDTDEPVDDTAVISDDNDNEEQEGMFTFLSKRKKNRKNRRGRKKKEAEQQAALESAEDAFKLVEETADNQVENIPLQTAADTAEMPTEVLTQQMAEQFANQSLDQSTANTAKTVKPVVKKNNAPQKVALPSMDDEEDE